MVTLATAQTYFLKQKNLLGKIQRGKKSITAQKPFKRTFHLLIYLFMQQHTCCCGTSMKGRDSFHVGFRPGLMASIYLWLRIIFYTGPNISDSSLLSGLLFFDCSSRALKRNIQMTIYSLHNQKQKPGVHNLSRKRKQPH